MKHKRCIEVSVGVIGVGEYNLLFFKHIYESIRMLVPVVLIPRLHLFRIFIYIRK